MLKQTSLVGITLNVPGAWDLICSRSVFTHVATFEGEKGTAGNDERVTQAMVGSDRISSLSFRWTVQSLLARIFQSISPESREENFSFQTCLFRGEEVLEFLVNARTFPSGNKCICLGNLLSFWAIPSFSGNSRPDSQVESGGGVGRAGAPLGQSRRRSCPFPSSPSCGRSSLPGTPSPASSAAGAPWLGRARGGRLVLV